MSQAKAKSRREMTTIIWAFVLSLIITAIAFVAVGLGMIQERISLFLFLVLLAILQVAVQLFYFMHLKDRGHRFPLLFAGSAVFVAVVLVAGIVIWM
ncbi:cytochrome C oxidase subunit IV family protein [Caldalkalibacillus horti]|uniref:Cytochrome c oxidase subunit 4 n=1 Tax=Caldalkalibacillus horti TaxID=77523 RepID=A0ABT9VV03_9BACI|nr:cytochrome C oxidase subunit IV family protein [Bacillus horti]MDQ0164815.1 cytochrome c oxidase subunit 4 [Bacillus horti]